jgi:predicted amidohydrolase YtcJ
MNLKQLLKKQLYLAVTLSLLVACNSSESNKPSSTDAADAIYFGGDIITMEGDSASYVEAIAVKNGEILFAGTKAAADKMKGDSTVMNDLQGKTLVPGFIDGHAHFAGFGAQAVTANLLAPPDGNILTIDDLVKELKEWHQQNGTDKTDGWIVGMGFDDAELKEKRFPTKEDLDKVSADIPVCIVHISGHFCVLNSKGLEVKKITASTKNPSGGVIRRQPNSNEPNGVLEELAAIPVFFSIVSPTEPAMAEYYLEKSQELAARFGYTTAQEGRAMSNHELLAGFADKGKLKIDVVSYIDYASPQYLHTSWNSKTYKNHYRIGGMKITLDGSPQGRTAWRTQPYLLPPDGQKKGYKGYPALPDEKKLAALYDSAFANNWQVLTHANGDAAIDQMIRNMQPAATKYGNNDRRNVLIHGQYIRFDQLDSLKKLEVLASLFPMHTFYWGDWHKQIIGDSLGNLISPIKTALNKGLRVTSHTDAPVALPNLMMILWTTVNRVSRSGAVIGQGEKLSPYEALQSVTIWGAYQHFEDKIKGSLTPGKLADMVILSDNPLKIDPMKIKDIEVSETIKEGQTVYKK